MPVSMFLPMRRLAVYKHLTNIRLRRTHSPPTIQNELRRTVVSASFPQFGGLIRNFAHDRPRTLAGARSPIARRRRLIGVREQLSGLLDAVRVAARLRSQVADLSGRARHRPRLSEAVAHRLQRHAPAVFVENEVHGLDGERKRLEPAQER